MRRSISVILLVAGLAIVAYGFMQKDDQQAEIDLGRTEITLGKEDSAFSPIFIVGGIMAVAGLVMLAMGRKS